MISNVSSMSSAMIQMQSAQMQQGPDPLNVFKTVDQDDSGGISSSELVTLTEGIEAVTESTITAGAGNAICFNVFLSGCLRI